MNKQKCVEPFRVSRVSLSLVKGKICMHVLELCTTNFNQTHAFKENRNNKKLNLPTVLCGCLCIQIDIEEEDFSELCAEILENWTSPVNFDLGEKPLHQNPFSLQSPIYPQQPSNAYDDEYVRKIEINSISSTNLVTKDEAKNGWVMEKHDDVMKARENADMAHNKTYEKGSKCEQAEKRFNDPVIPVLVADTFFDIVLGHGVDGVDVAALNKVKEVKECDKVGDKLGTILNENENENDSVVSVSNGKEMEKLNFTRRLSGFKCNSSMVDKMPKRSFISMKIGVRQLQALQHEQELMVPLPNQNFRFPQTRQYRH